MNDSFSGDSAKPLKILLADDSSNIHRAVALALRKTSYELIYCDNGEDALRIIQEQMPSLVLADLDMPGPTGREICLKIKTTPSLSNVKVILLCGSFDQLEDQKLDTLSADGRLWKPFESHVLLSLLSTVLKGPSIRPAEKTLFEAPRPTPKVVPPVKQAEEATLPQISPQLPRASEKNFADSADPIRELTSEMTRETFKPSLEEELPPPAALGTKAPPVAPWDVTEGQEQEPKISKKIETTESLPRDISPFEKTLPPVEDTDEGEETEDNQEEQKSLASQMDELPPSEFARFSEEVKPSENSLSRDELWTPQPFGSSERVDESSMPEDLQSDLARFREELKGDLPSQNNRNIELPKDSSESPTIAIDRSEFLSPQIQSPKTTPPAPPSSQWAPPPPPPVPPVSEATSAWTPSSTSEPTPAWIPPLLSTQEEEGLAKKIENKHASASATMDPHLLRQIVREEIQNSFNQWFKERLEQKLKEVIDEIEKD